MDGQDTALSPGDIDGDETGSAVEVRTKLALLEGTAAIEAHNQASTQDLIFEAIATHIQEHGPCRWKLVYERPEFADIIGPLAGDSGRRKFWRWVAAVKAGATTDRTKPHVGGRVAGDHARWADQAAAGTEGMPVPASPRYLRRAGGSGLQKLEEFAALIGDVLADAEAVRDAAVEISNDGSQLTVRNSAMLLKVGRQKLEIASAGLRLWREVQQLMEHERVYEGLYKLLHEELAFAPDVRARVFDRLGELFTPAPAPAGEDR